MLCQVARLDGARAGATRVAEVPDPGRQSYAWPRRDRPLRLPGARPTERRRLRQQEALAAALLAEPLLDCGATVQRTAAGQRGRVLSCAAEGAGGDGQRRRADASTRRRLGAWRLWSSRRDAHFRPETVFHALEGRAWRLTGSFPALSRNQRQPRTPLRAEICCPWPGGASSAARQDRWTIACAWPPTFVPRLGPERNR